MKKTHKKHTHTHIHTYIQTHTQTPNPKPNTQPHPKQPNMYPPNILPTLLYPSALEFWKSQAKRIKKYIDGHVTGYLTKNLQHRYHDETKPKCTLNQQTTQTWPNWQSIWKRAQKQISSEKEEVSPDEKRSSIKHPVEWPRVKVQGFRRLVEQ